MRTRACRQRRARGECGTWGSSFPGEKFPRPLRGGGAELQPQEREGRAERRRTAEERGNAYRVPQRQTQRRRVRARQYRPGASPGAPRRADTRDCEGGRNPASTFGKCKTSAGTPNGGPAEAERRTKAAWEPRREAQQARHGGRPRDPARAASPSTPRTMTASRPSSAAASTQKGVPVPKPSSSQWATAHPAAASKSSASATPMRSASVFVTVMAYMGDLRSCRLRDSVAEGKPTRESSTVPACPPRAGTRPFGRAPCPRGRREV